MVKIIHLPDKDDGAKQGLDDYLAAGHSVEDVWALAKDFSEHTFLVEDWPVLAEEALHGPAGEVVKAIAPNTESDPVALLLEFLSRFGNIIGRGAHFKVEGDTHYLKIWHVSVGETSKGRKGTAQGRVNLLIDALDGLWSNHCVDTGLQSGEGLIHRVRDRVTKKDKEGDLVVVDLGIQDKRLLVEEPEFGGPLTLMGRDGNILSMVLRNAWDDKTLQNMTKKDAEKATGTHITVVGHISRGELLRHLTEAKLGGGIANRFLFALVRRSKRLPFGGARDAFSENILEDLRRALGFGQEPRALSFSEDLEEDFGFSACELWVRVYPELSKGEPYLLGAVISRAEAQVRRLATLYAVLDCSPEVMVRHLNAALAIWEYCEDSARLLFGRKTGDRKADAVLQALREAGPVGLKKSELYDVLDRNITVLELDSILKDLESPGWVYREDDEPQGRGRPAQRWFACGD